MKLVGMKTSKFLMCGMAAVDVNSQIAKNGKSWQQLHIGSHTGRNQVKKTLQISRRQLPPSLQTS